MGDPIPLPLHASQPSLCEAGQMSKRWKSCRRVGSMDSVRVQS